MLASPTRRIEAVGAIESIYDWIGESGLRRTMTLNTHWKGQPKTNTAKWLKGLALFTRDGYDDAMTPTAWMRVVPAKVILVAEGETVGLVSSSSNQWGSTSYAIATWLRKKARLKQLPVQHREGGSKSRPL